MSLRHCNMHLTTNISQNTIGYLLGYKYKTLLNPLNTELFDLVTVLWIVKQYPLLCLFAAAFRSLIDLRILTVPEM